MPFTKGNQLAKGGSGNAYSAPEKKAAKHSRRIASIWVQKVITEKDLDAIWNSGDPRVRLDMLKWVFSNFPPREGEATGKGITILFNDPERPKTKDNFRGIQFNFPSDEEEREEIPFKPGKPPEYKFQFPEDEGKA